MDGSSNPTTQCIYYGSGGLPGLVGGPTQTNKCMPDVLASHDTCRKCRPYGGQYVNTSPSHSPAQHPSGTSYDQPLHLTLAQDSQSIKAMLEIVDQDHLHFICWLLLQHLTAPPIRPLE